MGKFDFGNVTTAPDQGPQIFTLYGAEKLGKTTFLCTIDGLFIVCPEEGLKGIDRPSPHFPSAPRDLSELYDALDAFASGNKSTRKYRHLAIDNLSWIERMIQQKSREKIKSKNLGDDYQAGKGHVDGEWDSFWQYLDGLRRRSGCHLWLAAHAELRKQPPTIDGDTYSKWDLRLDAKAAALVRAGSDHVLYMAYTVKKQGPSFKEARAGKRAVATYTGRVIYTRETADHFAGSRSHVKEVIPATWPDLRDALKAGVPASAAKLRDALVALMGKLLPADAETIQLELTKLGAVPREPDLQSLLSRAQAMAEVAVADGDADDDSDSEPQAADDRVERDSVASDEDLPSVERDDDDGPIIVPLDSTPIEDSRAKCIDGIKQAKSIAELNLVGKLIADLGLTGKERDALRKAFEDRRKEIAAAEAATAEPPAATAAA
jgi:hypothetical protein